VVKNGDAYALRYDPPDSIGRVHAFHGNFGILIRAYTYILSMGKDLKTASQHAVLSANYIKERLKDVLHLPFDRPCMHECVFTDKHQEDQKITTLDMAKRLMDYGFHPPTIYFPLVVHGAIMIEPTETEPKENLDQFIDAFRVIVSEAAENPELLRESPTIPKVRRMDEATAARKPRLCG
jgi:glycine dehydrogenase subunit 2